MKRILFKIFALMFMLPLISISTSLVFATPGDIDALFGNNGIVKTELYVADIAIQANGKILVAGSINTGTNTQGAILRLNKDGSIDENFGTNGIASADLEGKSVLFNCIFIQKNGKILVGGYAGDDFFIAKYNSNGTLDDDFGSNGIVITNVSGDTSHDIIHDILVQADGKIIVGGTSKNSYILARYNPRGILDYNFGNMGIIKGRFKYDLNSFYSNVNSISIQDDGKILAAGYIYTSDFGFGYTQYFALTRYNSNGSIDTNFGSNGYVITRLPNQEGIFKFTEKNIKSKISDLPNAYSYISKILIQNNGKILAIGESEGDIALVKYNNDGTIDENFGVHGYVLTDIDNKIERALDAVIQYDGKIIVGGTHNDDFILLRYDTDGKLDNLNDIIKSKDKITIEHVLHIPFGSKGYVITNVDNDSFHGSSLINAIALQSDGKIIAAGSVNSNNFNGESAIIRYKIEAIEQPNGKNNYAYEKIINPNCYVHPQYCHPVGLGNTEGGKLSLKIKTFYFEEPVDIYLALHVPEFSSDYFLFRPDNGLQALSKGAIAWKTSITEDINEIIADNISITGLPEGHYNFYFLVLPSGTTNLKDYYMWTTGFVNR